MKVALSAPPFLMINLTFALLSRCLHHSLKEFARILKIPSQGVCVYTPEWPISSLHNGVDSHPDIYPPPHEDSSLIRDALFYERTQPKTRKMKVIDTILDPFQMIVSELKTHLKKWEIILSENAISLTRNKDHPNHEGKRPRLPTPTPSNSKSSDSHSPTPHQGVDNDLVNNYTLDPIPYMNHLSPIVGGESPKFKQTKGMFKCLFYFLSKKK
ncbi:hypothetical protein Tco_0194004 [Tanacetum coccineum]